MPGQSLPRYFARAGVVYCGRPRLRFRAWQVCDSALHDDAHEGLPIHEGEMDEKTARWLADGLNLGTISPDEVAGA